METTANWIEKAVFYHIYPLGFTGAPAVNEGADTAGSRILKVIEWIPHLKELGVNAVYFGPIFESVAHGYDTTDYYKTDSRLGTKEDFKKVFSELKNNGIRIVLDGVFNHVGRRFPAFMDLQQKLWDSEYKDWFYRIDFGGQSAFGDRFYYDNWEGNADLVKLNLKNPAVADYLLEAVKMWIDEWDIDGLRLDAANCVDHDFFRKLRAVTKGKKQDFWLMGEIIHGDYKVWANPEMLDSVTNYECYKGIYSSHNDKNYFEIAHSLKRQFGQGGLYQNLRLYNFLDNHDVNRIASSLKDKRDLENVYTLLYMMPGVPSIYYGSEWGIEGVKGKGAEADIPLRPDIALDDMKGQNEELIQHIKKLSNLRTSSEAICKGSYEEVFLRNEQYAFARVLGDEVKIAAFNISESSFTFDFNYRGKQYHFELEPHTSCVMI